MAIQINDNGEAKMVSETVCEFDYLQTAVETKSSQSGSYVKVLNENPA